MSTSSTAADYFDGRSAHAHPVRLTASDSELLIRGDDVDLRVALRGVTWSERTRHGARLAHLPDGGSLQAHDAAAWDAWRREVGLRDSCIVQAQQGWRWVAASAALLFAVLGALFVWGLPWAARAAVAATPLSVDQSIGEAALQSLDEHMLQPSKLSGNEQTRLRAAFNQAIAKLPAEDAVPHRVIFRSGRVGPNAFALPGGAIVLTDDLVKLVDANADVLTGVLAHEFGHVRQRHGLRLLVQVGAVGVIASVLLGDFSTLLAAAPALLGQASYSRDAEREADAEALRVLKAAGISPLVMVGFFEKVAALRTPADKPAEDDSPSWLGIAIASHPADAERIRYFRDAAAR